MTNEGSETRTVRIAASAIEGGEDRTTTVTVASGGEERVDLLPETGEYRIEATVTDGPGQDELTRSVDGSVVTVAVGPEGLDLTEGSP